jgi:hypothetical protein
LLVKVASVFMTAPIPYYSQYSKDGAIVQRPLPALSDEQRVRASRV